MKTKKPDYQYLEECLREQLSMFLEDAAPRRQEAIAALQAGETIPPAMIAVYADLRWFVDRFAEHVEQTKLAEPIEA